MHQKTDKKIKLIFYIFLIIILTSINNYNFKIQNIFNIKYIYIDGLSEKKNEIVRNEIKTLLGENIIFINRKIFSKLIERNDTEYLIVKKKFPNKLIINFTSAKPICIIEIKDKKIILGDNGKY